MDAPTPKAADNAPAESGHAPLPRVVRDLQGWNAMAALAVGRQSGMLAAIREGPLTAADMAKKAGVDTHNAATWLGAMTAHGYLSHRDGLFTMHADEVEAFKSFPFDFDAIIDYTSRIPALFPAIAAAIRSGAGVPPEAYRISLGDSVGRIPVRLYEYMLIDWLDKVDVTETLRAGGRLMELGCAGGLALMHLAAVFPSARFSGIDLDANAIAAARGEAAKRGLANVAFEVRNVDDTTADDVDVVLILDALHHFSRPGELLERVRRTLKPGGRVVFAEGTANGNVDDDASKPFAAILMTSSILYCMQEGLHDHGAGLGTNYGTDGYLELLSSAGYTDVRHVDTKASYTIFSGVRP
jgi:2-polyprenyl-3-methyl-5-hydroxy-6-metoxy-1,4-benzoquinol methylase